MSYTSIAKGEKIRDPSRISITPAIDAVINVVLPYAQKMRYVPNWWFGRGGNGDGVFEAVKGSGFNGLRYPTAEDIVPVTTENDGRYRQALALLFLREAFNDRPETKESNDPKKWAGSAGELIRICALVSGDDIDGFFTTHGRMTGNQLEHLVKQEQVISTALYGRRSSSSDSSALQELLAWVNKKSGEAQAVRYGQPPAVGKRLE